ncbi:hypothetical protein GCM10022140_47890 [Rhodococcus aetherivorans]
MAVNPFVPYVRGSDETLIDIGPHVVLPALATATVIGVAGVGLCSASRRLFGAGMVLGESATLPWFIWNQWEPWTMWGLATWIWYVALWVLVLTAGLAGLAVGRCTEVQLKWGTSTSAASWLLVLIGMLTLVVLAIDQFVIGEHPVTSDNWGAIVWVTMALVIPVCAAAASPRKFAVSLLIGWSGAAAIVAYYSAYSARHAGTDIEMIIIFVALLPALPIIAASSDSHGSGAERHRV